MKTSGTSAIFLAFAIALAAIVLPGSAFAGNSAEDSVRAWLVKNNIQEGYDAAKQRFVIVDSCERELSSLDGPDFFQTRGQLSLTATMSAKSELIGIINRKISATDSVELKSDGGETIQTTKSIVDIFSKQILHGCTVLHVEESYEKGIYSVAVAVAWSEKLEKAAREALSGSAQKTTPEEDEAEWSAWSARTDFAKRIGPAQFTDSHGIYRYAGVGCVDVEGKKGKAILDAKRVAEQKAKQALAYSLWADTVAHTHAVTILKERASAEGETAEASEDFVARVSQACKRNIIKRDVFKGKVVHPLTGRTMYVHVAGIDPTTLAEQKVLEADKQ
jgi:hypothetical protein